MIGFVVMLDGLVNLVNQGYELEIALVVYLMFVFGLALTIAIVITHDDKTPPSHP